MDNRFLELPESRLRRNFEAGPRQDCIIHAAEKTIAEALCSEQAAGLLEFLRSLCLDDDRPEFAASVFCCLARQQFPAGDGRLADGAWALAGLRFEQFVNKDAAAQAVEEWSDPQMRAPFLSDIAEPVGALADYLRRNGSVFESPMFYAGKLSLAKWQGKNKAMAPEAIAGLDASTAGQAPTG